MAVAFAFVGVRAHASATTVFSELVEAGVPTTRFSNAELARPIGDYRTSVAGNIFLLAYYTAGPGSGLERPLRIVRYDRLDRSLRGAALWRGPAARADFRRGEARIDCLGSLLAIFERGERIYVRTHLSPSAGCMLVFSSRLQTLAALSGWTLGFVGDRYAVLRESEIHWTRLPQLALSVYDADQNRMTSLYPPAGDSRPRGADVAGSIAINASARAFAFRSSDSSGRNLVDYVYLLREGRWRYRAFRDARIEVLFGVHTLEEIVKNRPAAPFERLPDGK